MPYGSSNEIARLRKERDELVEENARLREMLDSLADMTVEQLAAWVAKRALEGK